MENYVFLRGWRNTNIFYIPFKNKVFEKKSQGMKSLAEFETESQGLKVFI
jgi:hypothetical protein